METGNLADGTSRGIKNSLHLQTPVILQKRSNHDVLGKLTLLCPCCTGQHHSKVKLHIILLCYWVYTLKILLHRHRIKYSFYMYFYNDLFEFYALFKSI